MKNKGHPLWGWHWKSTGKVKAKDEDGRWRANGLTTNSFDSCGKNNVPPSVTK